MGEWSGFFPSSGGDRKYKTAHIAAITDALFHSGVCQNDDLTLAPAAAQRQQMELELYPRTEQTCR